MEFLYYIIVIVWNGVFVIHLWDKIFALFSYTDTVYPAPIRNSKWFRTPYTSPRSENCCKCDATGYRYYTCTVNRIFYHYYYYILLASMSDSMDMSSHFRVHVLFQIFLLFFQVRRRVGHATCAENGTSTENHCAGTPAKSAARCPGTNATSVICTSITSTTWKLTVSANTAFWFDERVCLMCRRTVETRMYGAREWSRGTDLLQTIKKKPSFYFIIIKNQINVWNVLFICREQEPVWSYSTKKLIIGRLVWIGIIKYGEETVMRAHSPPSSVIKQKKGVIK